MHDDCHLYPDTHTEADHEHAPVGGAVVATTPTRYGRCNATYPGAATLRGRTIRCDAIAGHVLADGSRHANSFAARYWDAD